MSDISFKDNTSSLLNIYACNLQWICTGSFLLIAASHRPQGVVKGQGQRDCQCFGSQSAVGVLQKCRRMARNVCQVGADVFVNKTYLHFVTNFCSYLGSMWMTLWENESGLTIPSAKHSWITLWQHLRHGCLPRSSLEVRHLLIKGCLFCGETIYKKVVDNFKSCRLTEEEKWEHNFPR